MSEIIYILTVIYFAYVLEEVEGDRLVILIKRVFHLDLSELHKAYTSFRGGLFSFIQLKTVSFA